MQLFKDASDLTQSHRGHLEDGVNSHADDQYIRYVLHAGDLRTWIMSIVYSVQFCV